MRDWSHHVRNTWRKRGRKRVLAWGNSQLSTCKIFPMAFYVSSPFNGTWSCVALIKHICYCTRCKMVSPLTQKNSKNSGRNKNHTLFHPNFIKLVAMKWKASSLPFSRSHSRQHYFSANNIARNESSASRTHYEWRRYGRIQHQLCYAQMPNYHNSLKARINAMEKRRENKTWIRQIFIFIVAWKSRQPASIAKPINIYMVYDSTQPLLVARGAASLSCYDQYSW